MFGSCVWLVPLSNVNVVCEVVFIDSDCEFVEPCTSSLARKREACFAQTQEYMIFEGAQVKAPRAIRNKLHRLLHSKACRRHPDLVEHRCTLGQRGQVGRRKHHRKEQRWKWENWNIAVAVWNTEAHVGGRHATERLLRERSST